MSVRRLLWRWLKSRGFTDSGGNRFSTEPLACIESWLSAIEVLG